MSASNGGSTESAEGSSGRGTGRFPAPRPRASGAPSAGSAPTSSNPTVPRPRPRPSGPPTGATQQVRAQQPGQRPAGRGQAQLVRPTPKAKVRKARLLVSKVDPWSVLKMSFLLSVALGIMTVVCSVTLWIAMDMTGIFDRVNDLMLQILGTEGETGLRVQDLLSVGQVASFATIIAVVNVLLLTVLSMLASVLYNLSASLVGGIGVTLTDD